jgi:flagellar biosynthetic protein FliP
MRHLVERSRFLVGGILLVIVAMLLPAYAWAESVDLAGIKIDIGAQDGDKDIASAFQVLALLTVLSLAPAILMVLTAFTRIIIVFAMLRQAFGMPSTPPNTVLISLALFLTLFTMMPVIEQMNEEAFQPFSAGEMTSMEAASQALIPLRGFMIKQTREKDLALVIELSGKDRPATIDDIETTSLIPAFMLSELQTAFQIGFVIFLPFLLIDLLAASVLMAMGMIMVPPLTISLPIKVLMFVLIDGWALVTKALVGSFV